MELLPDFRLTKPSTLDELLAARASGAHLLAGGTDLLPNMRRGLIDTDQVVDLTGVPELTGITQSDDGLRIGAAVTLSEVADDTSVLRDYVAVAQAAGSIAGPTHRAMGTVGGNLCLDTRCIFYNQSEWWRRSNDYCLKYEGTICHVVPTSKRCYAAYSGDLAAALLVYNSEIEIAGAAGLRRAPLATLFRDDGADHLTLKPDELVVAVHVPAGRARLSAAYEKIRVRGSIDFPLAGIAIALEMNEGLVKAFHCGLTGATSLPITLDASELLGKPYDDAARVVLDKLVQKAVSPARTGLIQPQYRRRALGALAADMAARLI